MVKNFIFIEDGSVDIENMRKILDNSGNTDVKFITYKQGANKPELVSIENNEPVKSIDDIRKEIVDIHRAVVLDALEKFIDNHVECRVESSVDPYTFGKTKFKLIYHGKSEEFVEDFEEYLKNYKG